ISGLTETALSTSMVLASHREVHHSASIFQRSSLNIVGSRWAMFLDPHPGMTPSVTAICSFPGPFLQRTMQPNPGRCMTYIFQRQPIKGRERSFDIILSRGTFLRGCIASQSSGHILDNL